jgi:hypothetical protein
LNNGVAYVVEGFALQTGFDSLLCHDQTLHDPLKDLDAGLPVTGHC